MGENDEYEMELGQNREIGKRKKYLSNSNEKNISLKTLVELKSKEKILALNVTFIGTFSENNDMTGNTRLKIRYAHTGKYPFTCKICQRGFRSKHGVANHTGWAHTDKMRPFKCDICPKSFRQKSALDYHMQTHTGEKPFKCDICLKSYARNWNLSRHIKTHTEEELVLRKNSTEEELENLPRRLNKEDDKVFSIAEKELEEEIFTVKEEIRDNDNFYKLEKIELEPALSEQDVETEEENDKY